MKKKLTKFLFLVFFIGFCILLAKCVSNEPKSLEEQLSNINLDQIDHIMITAHPDDETIFGGNHLAKDHYLVVSVTAGNNSTRVKELRKVTRHYKDSLIMLGYPDKTLGKRDNWKHCYGKIYQDLSTILHKKNYKMIVTHNPDGEYGHIHHKMVSQMVTKITAKSSENLYYFNHYYTQKQLQALPPMPQLMQEESSDKLYVLKTYYPSQKKVINHLKHILPYEQLIPQKDWNSQK